MFKDSDKWVIEGNVQDNLLCVATFQRRRLENVSWVEVFLPKKRSKVWRRFEVSIDALRFLSTLCGFAVRRNFSTSVSWKRFLWGRKLLKRNAYNYKKRSKVWWRFDIFKKRNAQRSINALRFLSTLLCFYRRFAVLLCVVNFSTSQTWKRFLWGRKLLKRNAYNYKKRSKVYQRFEVSINDLRFLTTLWGLVVCVW